MTLGDRTACPDDELLTAYVEARLDEAAVGAVERHVAECSSCLDVVAACGPASELLVAEKPSPSPVGSGTARVADRRWRWALAAGLVLVAGGLLFMAAEYPQRRLAMGVSSLASRWFATPVQVDAIALRVGPSGSLLVSLRDVRLGRDVFRAEVVDVTVGLAALASGESPLRSIRLVRPVVSVTRPESLAVAWSERARARVLSVFGDAERVDVIEGRVEVRGTAIAVEKVGGGLERGPGMAKVVLQGFVGTGRVDVEGNLAIAGGRSAVTVSGRDVAAEVLPVLGRRLTGTADVRVEFGGTGDDLRVDGRVAVRNGRLLGANLRRWLRLDGEAARALVIAAPALSGEDLPFDDAAAAFAWRKGVWRFSRIFMTSAGAVAGGRIRVAGDAVAGHATIRLSPALAGALRLQPPGSTTRPEPDGAVIVAVAITGSPDAPRITAADR